MAVLAPDGLPIGVIRSWLDQMSFRVDLESRQIVVLVFRGLTIGRDDHAFIVREIGRCEGSDMGLQIHARDN